MRETSPQPSVQEPHRSDEYRGRSPYPPGPNAAGHGSHLRPDERRDRRRIEDDRAYADRQLTGLMALLALATPENTIVPFSGTAVGLRYTGPIERANGRPLEPSGQTGITDRAIRFRAFLRNDQMLRNAMYIVLNSGVQAALGFGFWIIAARFFDTAAVGRASSLISAISLLSVLGLLGLNTTFIRYLPVATQRNQLITAGITLVAVCTGVAAFLYVLLTPRLEPSVTFVARNAPMAVGFVLLTAAAAVNLLTRLCLHRGWKILL